MLGKLIKYDLKAAFRSFGPLYLALLGMSFMIGLFARFNVSENGFITFVIIAYGVTLIVCWVIPIVILTLRFKKNLLEDEGYLSFALPVSTLEHICAKVLSAMIITVVCALAVVLSFLLIGLISSRFDQLQEMMREFAALFNQYLNADLMTEIIKGACLSILVSVQIITHIYASLAIGHLVKDHETLAAVGAFIGISLITSFLSNTLNLSNAPASMGIYALYSIVLTAVFTCITWFIMDRHLNLG